MSEEIRRRDEGALRVDEGYRDRPYGEGPYLMDPKAKYALMVAAILLALVSFFVIEPRASSVEFHAGTISSLDGKKSTVTSLVAGSTGSSAAISLLPGDAGTPIAEKLVDISSDFLVVLAAIYLEKYLLTIMGLVAFRFLVPAGCAVFVVALLAERYEGFSHSLRSIGARLVIFGFASFLVVPVSVQVSNMIEATYESSINETIQTAEQTTEAIEESASEGESTDSANPLSFLLQMPDELGRLTDSAQNSLNNFIEALAVMVVTSCIIPILVLLFFLWLVKIILGVNVDIPMPHHRRRW